MHRYSPFEAEGPVCLTARLPEHVIALGHRAEAPCELGMALGQTVGQFALASHRL
jgi:hypothetical protein